MGKFSSGLHRCLLRNLLWILNFESIHHCLLKENHISIYNSCSLISTSQLYACSSYILSDIHENGDYSFTLKKKKKKKVKFATEKTPKAFENHIRITSWSCYNFGCPIHWDKYCAGSLYTQIFPKPILLWQSILEEFNSFPRSFGNFSPSGQQCWPS